MTARLPDGPNGRVHFGATTQDVMDSGLAMALRDSCDLLLARVTAVGDQVARLVQEHAATVMPGRTQGRQAVPTPPEPASPP
jgi:3-carboxy-cis,cis-muconate cycloisomerase